MLECHSPSSPSEVAASGSFHTEIVVYWPSLPRDFGCQAVTIRAGSSSSGPIGEQCFAFGSQHRNPFHGIEQGTEGWHQGHCPQRPGGQPHPRGSPYPLCPILGTFFWQWAAKIPNCAPFPGWENILNHCLPSTPLLITVNSCSLFSFFFWFFSLLSNTILINCFWQRQNKRRKILHPTPHS